MTSKTEWRGLRGAAVAVGLAAVLAVSGQAAGQGAGDFNGDGIDDLAIGVPLEEVDGAFHAGAVNVIYGTKKGLRAAGNQFWHQGNTGGLEAPEPDDAFGRALAVGDFDNDGIDDLAIGAAREDIEPITSAGVVLVLYGSDVGLVDTDAELWSQDGLDPDGPEATDFFGWALTMGDFNGDDIDDLAIGAPGEDNSTGAVHTLFGSMAGLTDAGHQMFSQAVAGMAGAPSLFEWFGRALAAGDFDRDGFDDLAVGVPFDDAGFNSEAGGVNVIYGSAVGLTVSGNQLWNQDSSDIKDVAEGFENFGWALATGDFNRDGFDDLAVGVPNEGLPDDAGGTVESAGAVNVIYGSGSGLSARRNQFWHQNRKGIKEVAEAVDRFGWALAAGDFDKDRFDDLAIGVPYEDLPDGMGGTILDAGAVNVLSGTKKGLTSKGDQLWHQNTKGIAEQADAGDWFGFALAAGRFNKGRHRDLVIGVPGEGLPDGAGGTISNAGAVNVLYGSKKGLSKKRDQLWHQDTEGVEDDAEPGENFGLALPGSPFQQ